MLKIGLTGGAATGKSTVSSILRRLGAHIIDVDLIARQVVKKGSPCLEEIAEHFGRDVLLEDGSLNRKKLGDMVFADKDKLERLNSIMHPAMIERVKKELAELERRQDIPVVVLDAAILIEMGLHRLADRVWLVRADRGTQIARLVERDGISREKAENIINSQMTMEKKTEFSDIVIENTGTKEDLETKIRKLWRKELTYCISRSTNNIIG